MKLNFIYGKWQSIILLIFILGFSNQTSALEYYIKSTATATSASPADWTVASNWAIGSATGTAATSAPSSLDNVNILTTKYVTIPLGATANCGSLTVFGTNANLNIQGTAKLNCTSINVHTTGKITFIAPVTGSTTNEIICSGIVTIGNTATVGTLTMISSSKLTCNKLVIGKMTTSPFTVRGVIAGRATTCTFAFTGNGNDIIPEFTGDSGNTTDFSNVIFDPGIGNTITIPIGFSALKYNIASGTVDFSTNLNYSVNPNIFGSSLTMSADTFLNIGGTTSLPSLVTYSLDPNSTINYYGAIQNIKGISTGYSKLALSGGGIKTLDGQLIVLINIDIQDLTTLDLAGNDLTLYSHYSNEGSGCIRSNALSSITYKGDSSCAMNFDNSTPGVTNVLKNFNVGDELFVIVPTEFEPLDITIQSPLNITGTVNFYGGHLVSNGNLIFKSNETTTAFVGPITDPSICGITGNVTVERYIPAGSNNGVDFNLGRAYRGLSSSVTGGTIFSNWQENGSVATLTGSILGNTLTTTDPSTPLAVGQHISGNLIPANTTITNIDNAASNEYEISTSQNVVNPATSMIARVSISNSTIAARFTGSVTANILTITAFTVGTTLTVGQKITGGSLVPNTVITIDNGDGTYTIGLEIPSQVIHYNGAPAGFGTHVTGLSCTDAQLGQNDSATGLDYTRSGNHSLYTYSNGSQVFGQVMSTKATNLVAGNPYLILVRGDRTIDLASNLSTPSDTKLRSTGQIVAGVVEITKNSNTIVGGQFFNDTLNSFNFVGNPYQAPVDLNLIYSDPARWVDLGQSYTVFDSKMNTRGAYVTFDFDPLIGSTNSTSVMDAILEPNQAFFVTTTGATPTLVFNESDKNVSSNAYNAMFRNTQSTSPKIKGSICNATTNKTLDGFIIAFSDTYNNSIIAEDTRKPSGNQDETFASTNDVSKMAIDKRNFPSEADEIPLSITQYRLTNYVMKFNVSNFDQMDAYLVDTYTATETTLNNNEINSYSFTVDTSIPASIAENRFKIVFRNSALQTNSNSINTFAVYPNPVVDNKFTIKSNQAFSGKDANVNIINSLGQKVFSFNGAFSTDGSLLVNPTVALSKGIYLVKVAVEGKVETKKLIIK